MNYHALKRCLDITAGVVGLLVAAPLLVIATLAISLAIGRPALFRQSRAGFHGKIFTLYKLRTMNEAFDESGRLLPDHLRITWFGRLLRRTSLDELPQLWNVLRGEMSLVGPRPLLPTYLPRYTERQRRRHEVKPGMTGWAQIHGRNELGWEERFEFDIWYVDHCGFWLDLKILAMTIWKVLRRDGISQRSHATMPEFEGTTAHAGSETND
ncbi:MAG TPA: sugar transferase [Bryobacteraceae bacterium]|nr:sugar transferase [Bryobacteraceae bacterium]